jgi:glycosyltransferase involved in cell wall biosynthesis
MSRVPPIISIVVPTRNRPRLVCRAVASALAQTVPDVEVIVVVDGPDDVTRDALAGLGDDRVRVVVQEIRAGGSVARNRGVLEARASWVALLDDDDEWRPDKLRLQLARAESALPGLPIVSCRLAVVTPRSTFILPRRLPAPGEAISEYLTVRRGPFHGEGFIQTSTILAPTGLLRTVPFRAGMWRLQEFDWILRATGQAGARLEILPDPLVVWHADENRPRASFDHAGREAFRWMRSNRELFTRRAYAAGLMSIVSSMAAPSRDPRTLVALLKEARRRGDPALIDYITFLQVWAIPPPVRRVVRERVQSWKRPAGRPS